MKKLIVTRSDNNIKEMTDITHPIIRMFSKKWNADFEIFDHDSDCNDILGRSHYRIMKVGERLNEYDKILSIDSDVIITPNCPNLFDIVPFEKVGTIYEDKGTRQKHRQTIIQEVQKKWGYVNWQEGYLNTGVFIVSSIHKNIFEKEQGEYWIGFGYDDIHFGWKIHKFNYLIHELDYRFNHTTMFSEPWNGNKSRFDSYIIHYAGRGCFDCNSRIKQIKKDASLVWSNKNGKI